MRKGKYYLAGDRAARRNRPSPLLRVVRTFTRGAADAR